MKRIIFTLLLFACSPKPISSIPNGPPTDASTTIYEAKPKDENLCNIGIFSPDVQSISMPYLFQNINKFDKKRIRMFGFIQVEGEDTTFVSSRWDHWVNKSVILYPKFQGKNMRKCNRKDVEIEAIFQVNSYGAGMLARDVSGYLEIISIREVRSNNRFTMPDDIVKEWNNQCPEPCEKKLEIMGGQIVSPPK